MKVICIDASGNKNFLVEGQVYDVEYGYHTHCGKKSVLVSSVPVNSRCICGAINELPLFREARFIPLSSIDETEILQEIEKQENAIKV